MYLFPAMILLICIAPVFALRACDPSLATCVTPPTDWEPSSTPNAVTSQLSAVIGDLPTLNWINPIPISELPTIDFDSVMSSVADQNARAMLTGVAVSLPTLPPLSGSSLGSVTGDASSILSRAQQIMNMASYATATTTPSPYQTIPLVFGTLPTFPAKLPIMDYKPDVQSLMAAISRQGPFLAEIDRIIGS